MLFNVEHDRGDVIEGYLIPDGFSEQPTIAIYDCNGGVVNLICDQARPAVVESGRHASGLVGFRIDENTIPGLSVVETLSIRDAKSGVLIYRRPQVPVPVPLKVIRLEPQLIPSTHIDRYCGKFFQYELHAIERFGHETVLQAFHLNAVSSIYLSGRLLMRNYEEFFDRGFQGIVFLTDPYYEMAGRIFLLKKMATNRITFLGDRDQLFLAPAAEYFAETDLLNEVSLRFSLKRAPQKVRNVLVSPMTRQLVCAYPEQTVSRNDVAPAIDLLSRFTIVGHDGDRSHFQEAVGELFAIPVEGLSLPTRHSVLEDIADILRSLPVAELMLEQDLILDHYVRQAMVPVQTPRVLNAT